MHAVLSIGLGNALVASALAVLAGTAGRLCRRPALRHGLWLLVLLKLLTPSFLPVPVPWPAARRAEPPAPADQRPAADPGSAEGEGPRPADDGEALAPAGAPEWPGVAPPPPRASPLRGRRRAGGSPRTRVRRPPRAPRAP